MRKISLLTILFTVLLSCASTSQETQQASYQLMDVKQFTKELKEHPNALLVDVRTANEFNEGTITNAINYDLLDGTFQKNIDLLDPSQPIYLFCAKGGRSNKASQMLKNKNFLKIIELKGGYSSWISSEKE